MVHHVERFVKLSSQFYRAMLRRAQYCYGKLSVRLSVRLSVTFEVS